MNILGGKVGNKLVSRKAMALAILWVESGKCTSGIMTRQRREND